MPTLPPELTSWSVVFAPLFSKRVWSSVQVLLTGAILAVGSRTVTAVLRVMGLSQEEQFQKYHRVLNRAKWSGLAVSRCLLRALIEAFVPDGPLLMALDDTIERRRGAKIAAKGKEAFTSPPVRRFGIAAACLPCRCNGCWCAIRPGNSSHRRSCASIRT